MADSTTTNYALTKPETGSSRDTWGAKLNVDWDMVDAIMAALCPIGTVADYAGANAPDGWLMCDGTVYPIATYPKLAAVLGTIFGGDGATTFAVPDCRGRVTGGVGTTLDTNGVSGFFTLGQKIGYFTQTITATYLPSVAVTIDAGGDHAHTGYTDAQGLHAHNGSTDTQGNHTHTIGAVVSQPGAFLAAAGVQAVNYNGGAVTNAAGNHAHNITTTTDGNHQHNVQTYNSGPHAHTGRIAGGGAALPLYQPTLGLNKIIFAGPPGHTSLSSPLPGAPALMASPMRGVG